MIEVSNISKIYGKGAQELQVLKSVSLQIDAGDFVAIMGPSGSGKSTLMNILGLLDTPSSGSYKLNGEEVSKLSEDDLAILRRHEIGFVFQQFNLLPRVTAQENVAMPLIYSQKTSDLSQAIEILKTVNLFDRATHKPSELSGGQQQRVAIARALINQPQIIFADEPTGNLDSASQVEIMKVLEDLNRKGITVIIVTHEDDVAAHAKRIIKIRDGKIQSDERVQPLTKSSFQKRKLKTMDKFSWSEARSHFTQGFQILLANKVRTALSTLGILIGVAAVVAMLAIGQGASQQIKEQLSSLGSNLLVLRTGVARIGGVAQDSGAINRLQPDDATTLKESIPTIKAISPQVNGRGQVTFQNRNWSTSILGTSPNYPSMHAAAPTLGRFFTNDEVQKRARVAVIGVTVKNELFGESSPVGELIKINKINFQVIGVLPEKGASGFRNQDDMIVLPYTTAMFRLLGKLHLDNIELEVDFPENIAETQERTYEVMFEKRRIPPSSQDDAYQIFNMADIQDALSQTSKTMSVLLATIAGISLIVGGIGIMNIMLVSVTERTREIGLRKAVGATSKDIRFQFLAESIVISAIGGISGILLGWIATTIISFISGWTTSVSAQSIILSFFFSGAIGVIFGVYPATKASRLNPIEALRYE